MRDTLRLLISYPNGTAAQTDCHRFVDEFGGDWKCGFLSWGQHRIKQHVCTVRLGDEGHDVCITPLTVAAFPTNAVSTLPQSEPP